MKPIFITLSLCLIIAGCAAPTQSPSSTATNTAKLSPVVSSPTSTVVSPVSSPTAAAPAGLDLPTPYVPFYATTNTENVILRANPGVKFDAKVTLIQGLQLLVLGRVPGGEWVFVQTPYESTGWVSADLLNSDKDFLSAPLVLPPDVQEIRGRVLDHDNKPVTGIMFGVLEQVDGAKSFSVTTDANGIFYGFLPASTGGTWSVTFDKAACSSNTMDANCNCIGACGTTIPESTLVTLPQKDILEFQWR